VILFLNRKNGEKDVTTMIDTRPLKQFALQSLPPNSALRSILLSEPDSLSCEEFLVKLGMWLKLIRIEEARKK
jgi:hypothetical protein